MPTPEAERILNAVDKIAKEIGESVVAVWYDGRKGERTLIGTAFFAERQGSSFLVTALHNFTENPGLILKVEFKGTTWTLNEMCKCISVDDDLWIGETSAELHQNLREIAVPELKRVQPESCRSAMGTVLMGCPEDLNRNLQGKPFQILPISTILEGRLLDIRATIPEAIVYDVNSDFLTTAAGCPVMPRPRISGMSGGPVFSWFYLPSTDENSKATLHYFLQGMILSWQMRKGYVVACNAARIATLVTSP